MSSPMGKWAADNLIAALVLLLSFAGNLYQCNQNKISVARADREEKRAVALQQQKSDFIDGLNKQVSDIDQEIARIRENIRLLNLQRIPTDGYSSFDNSYEAIRASEDTIAELAANRQLLKGQIAEMIK